MQPEDARHEALRLESWRDMEKLYDEGTGVIVLKICSNDLRLFTALIS